MTENRAQVSNTHFWLFFFFFFYSSVWYINKMPSKEKKIERKRWSGMKKKVEKKKNRGQKTVTHPVIRMFETRHANV